MRTATLAVLFTVALLSSCAPTQYGDCRPSNCTGCCTFAGTCVTGDSVDSCGRGGVACAACTQGVACVAGFCGGPPADGGSGTGKTASASIGPTGGSVELEGAVISVPAGALDQQTTISITSTTLAAPVGYQAFSPVYRFAPEGLVFKTPVTVRLPYSGDPRLAVLFHSEANSASRFERVVGTSASGVLTATVTHFSLGFVGNGVDYTEQGDRSCTVTRLLEGRLGTSDYRVGLDGGSLDAGMPVPGGVSLNLSSSVALIFTVEDCRGRPLTGLTDADFVLREDGATLSVEASKRILPARGLTTFATLSLDVSSSTQSVLPQLVSAAKAFVQKLQVDRALQVPIGLELFAGMPQSVVWEAPTLDTAKLLGRLDEVLTYRAPDQSSTNLHGAVVEALSRLQQAQTQYRNRNQGGAFSTGYVVLFTDGADTSGRTPLAQVVSQVNASPDRVVAVALRSPDFDATAEQRLRDITGGAYLVAPSTAALDLEFSNLAARIAGQASRTYLLGYCSPKRSGQHAVSVEVSQSTTMASAQYSFNANGFAPGCSSDAFNLVCVGKECGGLGCGGCDDRSAQCTSAGLDAVCRSFCVTQNQCGGRSFQNPNGYLQTCADRPESRQCGSQCVNTLIDATHCGGCNLPCGAASSCVNGACVCAPGYSRCNGACLQTDTDAANCGGCGVLCGPGATCQGGRCLQVVTTSFAGVGQAGFSVGPTHVSFCSSGTTLAWVPVTGGTPQTVSTAGTCTATAVDASFVYVLRVVSGQSRLSRVPIGGGVLEDIATGLPAGIGSLGLTQDSTGLVFGGGSAVYRSGKAPGMGPPCSVTSPTPLQSAPLSDNSATYWLGTDARLYRSACPATPTQVSPLPSSIGPPRLVLGGGSLWYLDLTGLMRFPLPSGPVASLHAGSPPWPQAIVADASEAYWVTSVPAQAGQPATQGVFRTGVSVTAPMLYLRNQVPQWVALDSQYVYFASGNTIYRAVR